MKNKSESAFDKQFNEKWKNAKFLYETDTEKGIIKKRKNEHYSEDYRKARYGVHLYLSLPEARRAIRISFNLRTPDGHDPVRIPPENYKLVKD